MTGEQYTMLLDAIQNNPKTWLFNVWHHPIFDFGPKQYRDDIHEIWGVPLYLNGCDIMFMGHAHYYVRSKKLALNGEMNPPLDPEMGTVQIVTGNGGAPLYSLDPNHDGNGYMVESYLEDYGYCELTVDGDTLRLRHILRDGTVFDEGLYTPNLKPSRTFLDEKITENFTSIAFYLYQNYPNPFNATTRIQFILYISSHVTLNIYDVAGREVSTLMDGFQGAGTYRLNWEGVDSDGFLLPSGIYFCRLQAGSYIKVMKMVLVH